jgi:hypothetical protein
LVAGLHVERRHHPLLGDRQRGDARLVSSFEGDEADVTVLSAFVARGTSQPKPDTDADRRARSGTYGAGDETPS